MNKIIINLGKLLFKYRNIIFPLIYVSLFLISKPGLFLRDANLDRYVCAGAILIILFGQLFRLLVIGYSYIKRGGKDRKVYASSLVKTGIFAHVRHPMYFGNFTIMIGFILLYGSPWAYLVVLPFFSLAYYSFVRNEENFLQNKFGKEYDDYATSVNRFIPNFSGIKNSLAMYHYDWKKALRTEYGTIFIVFCLMLLILLWKAIKIFGYEKKQLDITILTITFIPVILFYIITKYLKRTHKLDS